MFSIKKIAALVCAVAMAVTTFVMPVSADSYAISLTDGETAGTSTYAYFTLNVSGLADTYSKAGTIKIRFTPGVFSAVKLNSLDEDGLYSEEYEDGPETFSAKFLAGDEYDQVTVTWYGSYAVTSTTGKLAELRMKYTGDPADVTATIVNPADDNTVCVSLCDENGTVTVDKQLFDDNTTTYKIAAGTSTVTEVKDEPVVTAKVVGYYTGDKEVVDDSADETDTSVAILGTPVVPEAGATTLTWEVTPVTGAAQTFEQVVNVSGGATYKFGLVLTGLAKDAVSAVTAVLQ